ncbi:MAG: hypothetical protein KGL39_42925 [Patescibacteria group bacterium]|nr:hypothetical protein [Patescibacteria group bacterium]
MQPRSADEIDPGRLYSVAQARLFLPSPRGGCVLRATVYEYRARGLLKCVERVVSGRKWWFIWGSELLRFLGAGERPEWKGRTPAEEDRSYQRVLKSLQGQGVKIREDQGGRDV